MTIPYQSGMPAFIIAGNTTKWEVSIPDFPPSDGWSLSYALVKAGTIITIDATTNPDADDYLVSIAATTSAGYEAGKYSTQETVTDGTDVITVSSGKIEIVPMFSAQTSGYDSRSFAKQTVDAIEALIPVMVAKREASYTIGGKTVVFKSMAELQDSLMFWRRQYFTEERKAGRAKSRIIKPRFS
jgi:hypothetical protein